MVDLRVSPWVTPGNTYRPEVGNTHRPLRDGGDPTGTGKRP